MKKYYNGLKAGEKVFILCALVDEYGEDEPAIDANTFSWITATVLEAVAATSDGDEGVYIEELVEKYTTTYGRRFILKEKEISELLMSGIPPIA